MATCTVCGATAAGGAAFCATCGAAIAGAAASTASPATAGSAGRTSVDTERMRQAAIEAKNAFVGLGAEKITCIAGGVLGAIGSFLPYYSIPTQTLFGDAASSDSTSFVSQGGMGFAVLALAIVLGAAPLFVALSRTVNLVGFGIAMAVLGILIGDHTISFMGQSVPLDFGFGYYVMFLGFAMLAFAYGRGTAGRP